MQTTVPYTGIRVAPPRVVANRLRRSGAGTGGSAFVRDNIVLFYDCLCATHENGADIGSAARNALVIPMNGFSFLK
jgi:hypothetical protein